jgi:hypothetical protein
MDTKESMHEALDAIHDEAVKLLHSKGITEEIRSGLHGIIALARYKNIFVRPDLVHKKMDEELDEEDE